MRGAWLSMKGTVPLGKGAELAKCCGEHMQACPNPTGGRAGGALRSKPAKQSCPGVALNTVKATGHTKSALRNPTQIGRSRKYAHTRLPHELSLLTTSLPKLFNTRSTLKPLSHNCKR